MGLLASNKEEFGFGAGRILVVATFAGALLGACGDAVRVSTEGKAKIWFEGGVERAWKAPQAHSDLIAIEARSGSAWLPWTRGDDSEQGLVVLLEAPANEIATCTIPDKCAAFVELRTVASSLAFDGQSGSLRIRRSSDGSILISGEVLGVVLEQNRLWSFDRIRVSLKDVPIRKTGDVLGSLAEDGLTAKSRVLTRWKAAYGDTDDRTAVSPGDKSARNETHE